jgi:site-specific recombinase XerD
VSACVFLNQPSTTLIDASSQLVHTYDFKLHELRHSAASLATQAGANMTALQNMLGHESASLTLDRLRPPL